MTDNTQGRKVYLASRYANARMLQSVRRVLVDLGHEVTSTWIDAPVTNDEDQRRDIDPDPSERGMWAEKDVADLLRSDTLVLIDPSGKRGGCYVEQGMAMAYGLDVIVVGQRTNVFTYLCRHAPSLGDLPALLSVDR